MIEFNEPILDLCLLVDEQSDLALKSLVNQLGESALSRFECGIKARLCDLTTDKIVKLIKVFTRLDLLFSAEFGCGSTSQVHLLLAELGTRNPPLSDELRIWAFHTTKNPYVPFGTRNNEREVAQTVADYYRLRNERQFKVNEIEHLRSEQAKLRKKERAIEHNARIATRKMQELTK